MHISRQIVEHHKGLLDYISAEAQGTTFVLTLPLAAIAPLSEQESATDRETLDGDIVAA